MKIVINEEKLNEIVAYHGLHGLEETAKKFGLKYESVSRYIRYYKATSKDYYNDAPRILLLDIETAPNIANIWGVWKQNINFKMIKKEWFVISWCAKWLNDTDVEGMIINKKEVLKGDDKRILKGLHKLMDEADVVVAHNAAKFDIKRINTRFLLNGIVPPSPYSVVDTLKVARKHFAFNHNSLDALAHSLGMEGKIHTEHSLWEGCLVGDKESLEKMLEYNKQDVLVLEEIYYKFRGWMKHPNMNLFNDTEMCCPNCGSEDIKRKGYYTTPMNQYESYQCDNCGAISRRGRNSLASVGG